MWKSADKIPKIYSVILTRHTLLASARSGIHTMPKHRFVFRRGIKKGQATYIAPLNLVPLLASAPGGL